MQYASKRPRTYRGKLDLHPGCDLIFVDMPEGLPVPGVSDPDSSIPTWNTLPSGWLGSIFDFANQHLHDDGAMIIMHPYSYHARLTIKQHCDAFSFRMGKDWIGMNEMYLVNPANHDLPVRYLSFLFVMLIFDFDHCFA